MSRRIRDRAEYETGSRWFADWHRAQLDDSATMIDLDGLGYCSRCLRPHYVVEATRSHRRKTAAVAENLARMLGSDCLVVYRDEVQHPGEILVDWRTGGGNLGWLPESAAWDVFEQIRAAHVCEEED